MEVVLAESILSSSPDILSLKHRPYYLGGQRFFTINKLVDLTQCSTLGKLRSFFLAIRLHFLIFT